MKHQEKPLRPVCLSPFRDSVKAIAGVCVVMCAIILAASCITAAFSPWMCLIPLSGFVPLLLSLLVAHCFEKARITVSTEGVTLLARRSKKCTVRSWAQFSCLYSIEGMRQHVYLFTTGLMDKAAQLAAYKACCQNRELPYTHGDCLILIPGLYIREIDQRIPARIRRMPWAQCSKL